MNSTCTMLQCITSTPAAVRASPTSLSLKHRLTLLCHHLAMHLFAVPLSTFLLTLLCCYLTHSTCLLCLLPECAPGWGSHVPGWTGAGNLPTAPPKCPFLLVNGNNEPSCRCFRCPTGYTSTGGLLNSAAACRPTGGPPRPPPSPSPPPARAPQTAFIRVKFTAPASSNPCAAARQTRLANALAAGIQKRRPNARNVKVTVRNCRAVTTARRVAVRGFRRTSSRADVRADVHSSSGSILHLTVF